MVAALVACASLAGCKNTHSVDWYKAHNTERIAKLKQCAADPGELQYTPNCVNAKKAAADLMLDPKNGKVPSL
ncbi:MAG: EexN family lipoprotein [Acidiphilium sp.]|nr:EexN family lipoprotein [Acidiphilium sp.]MDD4937153.1 EexN family lipoprotein [Acidiphilium sp.]